MPHATAIHKNFGDNLCKCCRTADESFPDSYAWVGCVSQTMRIKTSSSLFEPFESSAELTNRHPRACFGHVVLIIPGPDGGAIGPTEAEFAGYEIIEATQEEKARLAEAGYRLKGLEVAAH